jgi:hypothetical protein
VELELVSVRVWKITNMTKLLRRAVLGLAKVAAAAAAAAVFGETTLCRVRNSRVTFTKNFVRDFGTCSLVTTTEFRMELTARHLPEVHSDPLHLPLVHRYCITNINEM